MKAISDVKMKKIIQKMLAPDATYEIGDCPPGDCSFQDALIEQASQMKPGEERRVYFYDNIPHVFTEGYGVAKLYYHEGSEQGGSAFVCVELFSGNERKYTNVVKSDIDGTWSCTDVVRLQNGVCFVKDKQGINATIYETDIGYAKMALVTIERAQGEPYTLMIDLDYQRRQIYTGEYEIPGCNGFFGAGLSDNVLTLAFEDLEDGTIASVKLFY